MKCLYGIAVGSGDVLSRIQSRALDVGECSTRCADYLNPSRRITWRRLRGESLSLSGSLNREAFPSAAGIGFFLSLCQPVACISSTEKSRTEC